MPLECRVMAYPAGPVSAILDWYGHTGEGMAVVSQARLAHVAVTQSVQSVEIFFVFIFQLFGWAVVAPLHFALQLPLLSGFHDCLTGTLFPNSRRGKEM